MANELGTSSLVFNGEIYNYHELQRQLASRGRRFQTTPIRKPSFTLTMSTAVPAWNICAEFNSILGLTSESNLCWPATV